MTQTEPAPRRGSPISRLAGATLNYGLGRVLPKVAGFLLIPLYTAYLSPADYGALDLATTFGGLLFILMRFGVPGAASRFYHDHREGESLRDFVTTISWFQIGASLAIGVLTLAAWPLLTATLIPGLSLVPIGVLMVVSTVLTGSNDIQRRIIQAREQSGYSARLSTILSVVQISSAVLFVAVFRLGVTGMLLSFIVSAFVSYFHALHYLAPDLRGRFRSEFLRESLVYAAGILPAQLINELAPLATRSMLAGQGGIADVGLLAIANRFASPLTLLVSAFSAAYLPVYFSMRKEDSLESREHLAKVTHLIWTVAMVATSAIVLLGPPVVRIMVPTEFEGAADLLPVTALGGLATVVYVLLSPEIYYTRRSWIVPLVTLATAAVATGVTALSVERFGAFGVAWANTAGILASAIVGAAFSLRLVKLPFDWRGMGVATAVCGGSCSLVLLTSGLGPVATGAAHVGSLVLMAALLVATRNPVVEELRRKWSRR